jgi:large subunit ribosomal protein L9
MELILNKDVEKLGHKDEIVTVKPGYGRNFLIPQGLATLATPSNRKVLAETLKQRAHKDAKLKEEALSMAATIEKLAIRVGAKAGESGKIFGSVNNIQIAEALKKAGVDLDRKNITLLENNIKNLGKYSAKARLHKEVIVEFEFEVVEE